jgi:hypothetical protein
MPAKKRKLPPALAANLFAKGGGRAGDAKKPAAKKAAAKPSQAKPKPEEESPRRSQGPRTPSCLPSEAQAEAR